MANYEKHLEIRKELQHIFSSNHTSFWPNLKAQQVYTELFIHHSPT